MILLGIFLISLFSSQLTHYLVGKTSWGAVRSSAFTTVLFSLCLLLLKVDTRPDLSAAYLGASFLGMSDRELFSPRDLIFASAIFTILFVYVLPFNIGLGGALGVAAFSSCLILRCLRKVVLHFV